MVTKSNFDSGHRDGLKQLYISKGSSTSSLNLEIGNSYNSMLNSGGSAQCCVTIYSIWIIVHVNWKLSVYGLIRHGQHFPGGFSTERSTLTKAQTVADKEKWNGIPPKVEWSINEKYIIATNSMIVHSQHIIFNAVIRRVNLFSCT